LPYEVFKVESTSPLSSFVNFNGTSKDSHYASSPEITFQDYDDKGNIIEATSRDGLTRYYVWGYNDQYPIAKIEGANIYLDGTTEATIKALENFTEITDSNKTGLTNLNIGIRYLLPSAYITTYTYDPLVGMTSQTDANGVTQYFEYDDFGRLHLAKDADDNIIERYNYNYKQ
jgi:YD repeat-containing protein